MSLLMKTVPIYLNLISIKIDLLLLNSFSSGHFLLDSTSTPQPNSSPSYFYAPNSERPNPENCPRKSPKMCTLSPENSLENSPELCWSTMDKIIKSRHNSKRSNSLKRRKYKREKKTKRRTRYPPRKNKPTKKPNKGLIQQSHPIPMNIWKRHPLKKPIG